MNHFECQCERKESDGFIHQSEDEDGTTCES